jgi:hypothetical protein
VCGQCCTPTHLRTYRGDALKSLYNKSCACVSFGKQVSTKHEVCDADNLPYLTKNIYVYSSFAWISRRLVTGSGPLDGHTCWADVQNTRQIPDPIQKS